jgi:WD40 repeat protein
MQRWLVYGVVGVFAFLAVGFLAAQLVLPEPPDVIAAPVRQGSERHDVNAAAASQKAEANAGSRTEAAKPVIGAADNLENVLSGEPVPRTWDEIETIMAALRKERATRPAAMQDLRDWYQELASPRFTQANDYLQHFQNLKTWAQSHPDSVTQKVVVAKAYIQWAWQARGGGYAFTVGEEGWELFHGRLTEARRLLDEVEQAGAPDGEACALRIQLAKSEGLDEAEVRKSLAAGQKLDPGYCWMYSAMAEYLLPRWHGEPGDVEQFASEIARTVPGDDGLDGAGHIAFVIHMYDPSLLLWGEYDRKLLGQAAAVLAKRYPKADRMVNFAAYCAYAVQDQEAARSIRPLVLNYNEEVRIWPWQNAHESFLIWSEAVNLPKGEKNWVWGTPLGCRAIAFDKNSGRLWSAEQSGHAAALLNTATGQKELALPSPGNVLNEARFDTERGWVLAAFWGEPFTGWVLYDTQGERSTTHETPEQVRALAIDPAHPRVAWAEGKTVHILDLDSEAELPPQELSQHVHGLRFSSDGNLLLVQSNPFRVLDATTGAEKYTLLDPSFANPPHDWMMGNDLAFDEEGCVWAKLHSRKGLPDCLVRFAPDGKTWHTLLPELPAGHATISKGRDRVAVFKPTMTQYGGSVEVWDVKGAKKLADFPGHWDAIEMMTFSPDGKRLATVGMQSGIIKIWAVDQPEEP